MTIQIKTSTLDSVRNTFAHIEQRFGDKPATRYQEATYDLQGETNYHYRPYWDPEHELNDPARTALVMSDWYAFKDPRQFYYGSYVQHRARMQDSAENNYAFFEKRNLAELLPPEARDLTIRFLIPLRHVEQTANLNNMYGTAYGYGTAITQALLYNSMDRLGIAQYLSRIGLLLDGNSGDVLRESKAYWMDDPIWQGMRALCEESLITKDWFELFLAQDIVIDTLVFDLFYNQLDQKMSALGGRDIAILTEFMQEWNKDTSRWADTVIKTAAAESAENLELMQGWIAKWTEKVTAALKPLAEEMLGPDALDQALAVLDQRLSKAKLK